MGILEAIWTGWEWTPPIIFSICWLGTCIGFVVAETRRANRSRREYKRINKHEPW